MRGVRPDKHKQLHIVYYNARSLYPKLDELHALCYIERPEVVCITETWLCDDIGELEVSIPGYSCVRCDRNRHGGAVALFISDKLEYQVTMCGPNELEFLLVTVHSTNNVNKKVYIGLWYWPPANSAALDDLYSIFESLDISVFSSFILLGDFNIDFCNHHHPLFSKLSSFFTEFCTYAGRTSAYPL